MSPLFDSREREKVLASTKHDPAFISKGYTNWRDAIKSFNIHLASRCHQEAILAMELPKETVDVGERLSSEHEWQKEENRSVLGKILENIRFGQSLKNCVILNYTLIHLVGQRIRIPGEAGDISSLST